MIMIKFIYWKWNACGRDDAVRVFLSCNDYTRGQEKRL